VVNLGWATAASAIDFDRDGRLDLVVGNYLIYDPGMACTDIRGQQEFCGPKNFASASLRLWHNLTPSADAPIRFEDVTERSQVHRVSGAALALFCADFDGDLWPDIFCSDDGRANRLFINRHDGTFSEEAGQRGLAFNAMGQTAANMGLAVGDVDGDGLWDLWITHLTDEYHGLWKQGPPGLFSDQVAMAGLQQQAWRGTGFGTVLADFDLDGDLDLSLVNGLVRRSVQIPASASAKDRGFWQPYMQRAQLFANQGQGRFQDISESQSGLCAEAMVGRGMAVGDLNNDGRLDLLVQPAGGWLKVFLGRVTTSNHWLEVRAVEPTHGARDAIGAEVIVEAGDQHWWRILQPATSYLSNQDPTLHFGLGTNATVDRIRVRWVGGEDVFAGGPVDHRVIVRRGSGHRGSK
jgi:enediyne biosynthesis protein E4